MPDYRVGWYIDVDANNPREAAKQAQDAQRRPGTIATVFEVFPSGETSGVEIDLSEPEGKRVPDFSMDVTGEYLGNAYPQAAEYRVTLTILGTGTDFGLVVENSSGGVVNSVTLSEEDADGIEKVATTMHGLEVYEDDWQIPSGIDRAVSWDLSDAENYIRLDEGQISEINNWLRYAVGDKTWNWDEQGEVYEA